MGSKVVCACTARIFSLSYDKLNQIAATICELSETSSPNQENQAPGGFSANPEAFPSELWIAVRLPIFSFSFFVG